MKRPAPAKHLREKLAILDKLEQRALAGELPFSSLRPETRARVLQFLTALRHGLTTGFTSDAERTLWREIERLYAKPGEDDVA